MSALPTVLPTVPAATPRAVVRRFVEEYQTLGKVEVAEALLAPDFVDHAAAPGMPAGREGVKRLFAAFRAAFPDFRAVIHDQIEEGDKVVTRKTFHGTHRGELMGVAPTGKTVAFDVIDIVRVRDGRMCEHWNVVDQLALLRQLGVVP
jgi:steroid delta-isomerase-like uncharacterized protein